jgi:ferric-dicitrate binding protein FerR (iron transport regulator)
MRKNFGIIIATALIATAFAASRAQALAIVSLKTVKGKIEIREKKDADWTKASEGDRLATGWQVRTGVDSEATLVWPQGHLVKIFALTTLTVEEATSSNKSEKTSLAIDGGKMFSKVKKLTADDSTFTVKTPTAVAGVRGTEFMVEILSDNSSKFSLLEGQLDIVSDQTELLLEQNKEVEFGAQMAAPPAPVEIPAAERTNLESISNDVGQEAGAAAPQETGAVLQLNDDDVIQQNLTDILDTPAAATETGTETAPNLPPLPPDTP